MAELFAFGTFAFWVLLSVEIILLFIFVANENGLGATVSIIAYGVILQWFGGIDILSLSYRNWPYLLMFFFSYFSIGALWAREKWRMLVNDFLEEYEETKRSWLRGKGVGGTKVPDELKVEWAGFLRNKGGRFNDGSQAYRNLHHTPIAYEYKGKWIHWATFWVPSLLYYITNDLVRRTFRAMFKYFVDNMQGIADRKFESVKDDLPKS